MNAEDEKKHLEWLRGLAQKTEKQKGKTPGDEGVY